MKVIPSQRPYSYEKKQFTYGQRTLDVLWLEHKYTDASFRRAGIGFRLSYDTFQLSNKESHSSSFSSSFIEFFRLKTQFSQHTRRNLSAPITLAVGGLLISALGIYGFIVGNFRIPDAVSSGIPCPRGFVIPEEIICGFIIRAGRRPAVSLPVDSKSTGTKRTP